MGQERDPSIEWAVEDPLTKKLWRDTIIAKLTPWAGDRDSARSWMREQPIPGFGATAEELIAEGRGESVLRFLERIEDGGYA